MAAGVLLTGGASSRLGVDKATVSVDGVPMAERAGAVLTAACSPCVEVGPGRTDLFAVQEVPPRSGPLAALVAGWRALAIEHGHGGPVVLLACDMPRVTPELLELVAGRCDDVRAAIPEAGGRLQPLCACYPPPALDVAQRLLDRGESAMHSLLDALPHVLVPEASWEAVAPPDAFRDVDTPADLEAL